MNELPVEKWSYDNNNDYGILRNYLDFTFGKLWDERAEASDEDKQSYIYLGESAACFNTGLFDKNWQPIYLYCVKNPVENRQPWKFTSFYNSYTIKEATGIPKSNISNLRRANYFDDPSALIFNVNLEIIPQWKHILDDEENFKRIPEQFRALGKDACHNAISGAISRLHDRIAANYKTVVPQYYRSADASKGKIQLLAPLFLTNNDKPDLALVLSLSEDKTLYWGHTCLTMEMAYNNARLIARPDSDWLKP